MKKNFIILVCFGFSILFYGQENQNKVIELKKELLIAKSDTTRVSITSKIAKLYLEEQPDSAFYYYNQALNLAIKVKSEPQEAALFYNIGEYYQDRDEHKNALKYFLDAIAIYNVLGNTLEVASLYNLIGANYVNLYAEDKGIEYYLKSLTAYESISDIDGVAINYIDIGNLYYDQENYEFAIKYFIDALIIFNELKDSSGIATCYINLANAIADKGDINTGLIYYKYALQLEEKSGDQYSKAVIYNNMGDCFIGLKDYTKAKDHFFKSLKIAKEIDDESLISIVFMNIADTENKLKNYDKAINNAAKSLKLAREIGDIDYEKENLKILSIAQEGLGNKTKAFDLLKEFMKIGDSLLTIDKTKKVQLFNTLNELEKSQFTISDLSTKNELAQLKYESGKKFNYFLIGAMVLFSLFIILLIQQRTSKKNAYNLLEYKNHQINRMNDKIQVQRDGLKQLNKTKDKFFSIIAHDLKNPINSINGFTELMIENNHKYEEEKRLKFLSIIKGSTARVTNLLDNLLTWANSQSENLIFVPQKIQLIQEISDVIALLEIQAVNKEIEIVNNISNDIFVNADKNMLATIFRNLISNAIKFTKPKGQIKIYCAITSNFVEITVKDSGIGISKSDIKDLFSIEVKNSNVGTANEQGSGLGLILCREFIEKHGGKIWVNSSIGEGSEFKFTLPKSH
jgi:signal transduction histidine kinase/Tfp pilus assembly protein PilF